MECQRSQIRRRSATFFLYFFFFFTLPFVFVLCFWVLLLVCTLVFSCSVVCYSVMYVSLLLLPFFPFFVIVSSLSALFITPSPFPFNPFSFIAFYIHVQLDLHVFLRCFAFVSSLFLLSSALFLFMYFNPSPLSLLFTPKRNPKQKSKQKPTKPRKKKEILCVGLRFEEKERKAM